MRLKLQFYTVLFSLLTLIIAAHIPSQFNNGLESRKAGVKVPPPPPHHDVRSPAGEKDKAKPANFDGYIVRPKNGKDKKQRTDIEKFFKDLKVALKKPILVNDEVIAWLADKMSDDQLKKARAFSGISTVKPNLYATKENTASTKATTKRHDGLEKRDSACRSNTFGCQTDAADELVSISQPPNMNIDKLKGYIYEKYGGKGTYIYHIGSGVEYQRYPGNFLDIADTHLQSDAAFSGEKQPEKDHSPDTNYLQDTCTAHLALGEVGGSSKRATLIVAQMSQPTAFEFIDILNQIRLDQIAHPNRRKKSVAYFGGTFDGLDPKEFNNLGLGLENLYHLDLPLVVGAGSIGGAISGFPQLFDGPRSPVIVVGATDSNGKLWSKSQTGKQVVTHAMGVGVSCPPDNPKDSKSKHVISDGTGFAAALVAGEIANLFSLNPAPFDTTNGKLISSLKAYLQGPNASIERAPGVKMIWNGVTKQDHEKLLGFSR